VAAVHRRPPLSPTIYCSAEPSMSIQRPLLPAAMAVRQTGIHLGVFSRSRLELCRRRLRAGLDVGAALSARQGRTPEEDGEVLGRRRAGEDGGHPQGRPRRSRWPVDGVEGRNATACAAMNFTYIHRRRAFGVRHQHPWLFEYFIQANGGHEDSSSSDPCKNLAESQSNKR
jgi:hypothetical protein